MTPSAVVTACVPSQGMAIVSSVSVRWLSAKPETALLNVIVNWSIVWLVGSGVTAVIATVGATSSRSLFSGIQALITGVRSTGEKASNRINSNPFLRARPVCLLENER